jgi:hypothetical protein
MRLAVLTLTALLLAAPAQAERLRCTLACTDPACPAASLRLSFLLDRNQFLPPAYPDDPPQRLLTQVELNGARFAAEPILMEDGTRGFWTEAAPRIFTLDPEGLATYSDLAAGVTATGRCEEVAR